MLELLWIVALAFVLELVDNGLGGGFGTIMSPLLIIFGFSPLIVVPAVLMSEMCSGLWGAYWHGKFKNIDYRVSTWTLVGAIAGMVIATLMIGLVLSATQVKWYISIIAVAFGVFVIVKSFMDLSKWGKAQPAAWKVGILGFICGFNKGGTGGGYGPLSVSGYMVLGLTAAVAIGTTTLAEGIASSIGFAMNFGTIDQYLFLAVPLIIGSMIADPVGAYVNDKLKISLTPPFHGRFIGVIMVVLGSIALAKVAGLF